MIGPMSLSDPHRMPAPPAFEDHRLRGSTNALVRVLAALLDALSRRDRGGGSHGPRHVEPYDPPPALPWDLADAAHEAAYDPWNGHQAPAPESEAAVAPPPPPICPAARAAQPLGGTPGWTTRFMPPPGVRFMRTPDHILRRRRAEAAEGPPIAPDTIQEAWRFVEDLTSQTEERLMSPQDMLSSVAPFHVVPAVLKRIEILQHGTSDVPPVANDETDGDAFAALAQAAHDLARDLALAEADRAAAETVEIAEPVRDAKAFAVVVRPKAIVPARVAPVAAAPTVAPSSDVYEHPPIDLLAEPQKLDGNGLSYDALEQNARLLEGILEDFGVRGEIIHVRAGPVVTLYELEPAPGIKSSRVIGLADDIARSMSAVSARVAVVPGRNVIGIELPNQRRETVYLREMIEAAAFSGTEHKLALCLGKTIGGEPIVAELAKMPHLLVAGTTGSGKSVAINTMILSLLYRLRPDECRLIMVDPKMLELSVYDGIPHLLTPVVTDPKKAVVALKWAVREMEDRYKKMSRLGVRNIDGFNARVKQAAETGEVITRTIETGFEKETGRPTFTQEPMDLTPLPYIVVIVDEMADLMMVAGKDIEGAIQRLAQMARAAGIHLIMATQRPSVDVITGTIKANFPTRISFQVTSKIDSRTILGEQGAEQLLGQGDMLHMQGGGRIYRVHGPFVSDGEVEKVVAHLKAQGRPDYLESVTEDDEVTPDEDNDDEAVFDKTAMAAASSDDEDGLYEQAVKVVLRDKKCSTSYIQRRMQIGYNRAASLVERMEKEGLLGPANHAGKREILAHSRNRVIHGVSEPDAEV